MKAAVLTHYDKKDTDLKIQDIPLPAAGRKYDKMAAAKNQTYDFLFVHEDGHQLEKIASLFDKDHPLEISIDTVFSLDQVNEALAKVKRGGSKGKTIIKVHESRRTNG